MSDQISEECVDGVRILRVKVVNRTRYKLINVKYSLNHCDSSKQPYVFDTHRVEPLKEPATFFFVGKYSEQDNNALYAYRFGFKCPEGLDLSKAGSSLEFSIYAEHEFSNAPVCVKKEYKGKDAIICGRFETRTSMVILHDQK